MTERRFGSAGKADGSRHDESAGYGYPADSVCRFDD